jgi:hypothetical protein
MKSNVEASKHYEQLFNAEMSLLQKVSAHSKAENDDDTLKKWGLTPLKPVSVSPSKLIGAYASSIANKAFSRPGMALIGAGLGAAGLAGGKYLYDKYLASPDPEVKASDIEALAEAERYRRDAKLRELGIAGASLTAGLVLPEILRMGSRAVPFMGSDFDSDDIRKMMRD